MCRPRPSRPGSRSRPLRLSRLHLPGSPGPWPTRLLRELLTSHEPQGGLGADHERHAGWRSRSPGVFHAGDCSPCRVRVAAPVCSVGGWLKATVRSSLCSVAERAVPPGPVMETASRGVAPHAFSSVPHSPTRGRRCCGWCLRAISKRRGVAIRRTRSPALTGTMCGPAPFRRSPFRPVCSMSRRIPAAGPSSRCRPRLPRPRSRSRPALRKGRWR